MGVYLTYFPETLGIDLFLLAKIIAVAVVGYFVGIFLEKLSKKLISNTLRLTLLKSISMRKAAIGAGIEIGVSEIIGKSLKYITYLLVLVLIFDFLGVAIVRDILLGLLNYINNIITAFLVLLIGVMLAEVLSSMIKFSLSSSGFDELFREAGREFAPSHLVAFVFKYLIYLISITIALGQLGLQTMLLTIIFGGAAIVMTIFVFGLIFFAVKDMVPDILTGIFIRSSGFIKQGERIEVDGFRGQVKKIGLLTTQIKGQRETMKLQNSQIIRKVKILHK